MKDKDKDTLLTIKDWIESFWEFQEEDLKLLTRDLKESFQDPKGFLSEIKKRIRTRKGFYNIFKHLSLKDIPPEDLPWVEKKLDAILAREAYISENLEKILEIFSSFFTEKEAQPSEEKPFVVSEEKIIFH